MRKIITLLSALILLICASLYGQEVVVHFNVTPTNQVPVDVATNTAVRAAGFNDEVLSANPTAFTISAGSVFSGDFSWTIGAETVTNGGGMLAIDISTEADAGITYKFGTVYNVVCGGFFFLSTATNAGTAYVNNEPIYIQRAGGNAVTPLMIVQTNTIWFRAHGGAPVENGPPIIVGPVGTTNWITFRAYPSNMVMAVYNPHTWQQVGSNSSINWPAAALPGYERLRVNAWDNASVHPTKTNYFDSILLTTNDVFPYFPTGASPPLSSAYVQSLIDNAAPGSTVSLPAGAATWTTNVLINRKAITLVGHASGTWITNSQAGMVGSGVDDGGVAIRVNGTSNGVTRISRINIVGDPNRGNGIYVRGDKWSAVRIDRCVFINTGHGAVDFWDMIAGVVDHCSFFDCQSTVNGYALDHMNNSWTNALTLGTTNTVVVENNVIRYTAITNDAIGTTSHGLGGRSAWRHNTVTNTMDTWMRFFDCHGNQEIVDTALQPATSGTTNTHRGTRQVEIYNNTIVTTGTGILRLTDFRGGTIICYSNIFLGSAASSTFHAREEDAPYSFNFRSEYPGFDQHWIYAWGNTSEGSDITALDFGNAGDAVFLVNDVNVFWVAPTTGTGLVESYTPLVYPHPLVTLQDTLIRPQTFRIQGKMTFSGNAKIN